MVAVWIRGAPLALALFVLRDSRLYDLLDQGCRRWLLHGKLNGPLGNLVTLQFILELLYYRCRRKQTAVSRKCGVPHQHAFVSKCGNAVADDLLSFRGHNGPNRRADAIQRSASRFWHCRQIFIHALRLSATYDATLFGVRLFHAAAAFVDCG